MRKTRVQSLGWEDLEKEMATYSIILAWKIPCTESGGLTVHGVARVGHDLATRPPPPQKLIKSRFGDMGLGINDFILGPLACFEQKSPPGPS